MKKRHGRGLRSSRGEAATRQDWPAPRAGASSDAGQPAAVGAGGPIPAGTAGPARTPFLPPWPRDVALLLALLSVLLFASQYLTLPKFAVLPLTASHMSLAALVADVRAKVALTWVDATLFTAMAATLLGLVGLEVRGGGLTRFLAAALASERRALLAVVASGAVLGRCFLGHGNTNWVADSPQHVCYAYLAAQALRHFELPTWSNCLGAGIPYLQYYGFLFSYLVGLVHLVVPDFYAALKVALAAGHVGSGVSMYLLVRTMTQSRHAGLVAGIGYLASFWHTQHVLIMGRLPLSLFYALAPLPFYFVERLRRQRRPLTCCLAGAAALGSLGLVHPGYAFWATALLGLYAVLRLPHLGAGQAGRRTAAWTGLMYAGGVLFGGYLTLGMWLEAAGTGLEQGFRMGDLPGREFVEPFERVVSYLTRHVQRNATLLEVPHWQTVVAGAVMLNVRYLVHNQAGSERVQAFDLDLFRTPVLVSGRATGLTDEQLRGPGQDPAVEAAFRTTFPEVEPELRESLRAAFPAFYLVQQTAPSLKDATCARVLLRDGDGERDLGTRPHATVLEHRVWEDRVLLRVRVSAPCYARLAYSYHRSLEARVDGQSVPLLETAERFVALALAEGEHTLELRPRLSWLRRSFLAFDVALLLALVAA
ncbi:MAG: hypothetical protein AB1505_26895, partial [Candidatus Latescibacterota bacterium]